MVTKLDILPDLMSLELDDQHFETISRMMYDLCGIKLPIEKKGLIKSRLTKRLRLLGIPDFDQYMRYVEADKSGQELTTMIDSLTTNKTSFFRESQHFDYLRTQILPNLKRGDRRLRIWSAGCSSGEEPYTLGIVLREEIPDIDRWDARILATDISTKVIALAKKGVYEEEKIADVPQELQRRYFIKTDETTENTYRVSDPVKSMVHFARLNLMEDWPMKGPFDMIFCRNVMIYFDKPTQQKLVSRYCDLLVPGGHLFVGHSESLTAWSHQMRYVQPAVYVK